MEEVRKTTKAQRKTFKFFVSLWFLFNSEGLEPIL